MPDLLAAWTLLSADVTRSMAAWRQQHPHATRAEIETALDARLDPLRAQMLQDAALTSPAADWTHSDPASVPQCPTCAHPLQARGRHVRHLQTMGGQEVTLGRRYGTCPRCGGGFFPPR